MRGDCGGVSACPHLSEGQPAGEFQAQHDHPGHPEEEDVMARLQQRPRVEHTQIF